MKMQMSKSKTPMKMIDSIIISLPTPSSISYMWNWGSLLGIMMMVQIITGILLSSHYSPSIELAYSSVIHISRDINWGWMMRYMHLNGASMLFIMLFIHISRGILFSSFKLKMVWTSGVAIILVMMGTAFLGYVLPWGQMSFWGATVITNLMSAIPLIGNDLVMWLWGGFSINQATLSRFFSLHFLMPFAIIAMIMMHLTLLHSTGSNNPLGINSNNEKSPFNPPFYIKDMVTIIIMMIVLMIISTTIPLSLGDPENFNQANPLNTPIHIQPEWYFLFAYAILRSIPNKLGGVIALVMSIMMLMILPSKTPLIMSNKMNPLKKMTFWWFSSSFILLTWIGQNPIEPPFEMMGMIISTIYFMLMMML